MTDRQEMEAALEAVLFVAKEPLSRARLVEMFPEKEREEAGRALEAVLTRYSNTSGDWPEPSESSEAAEGRGIVVDEVGDRVRLVTRPDLAGWLRRFYEVTGSRKLSMGALETLAIVAYRQPITGPEIQELRGVNPAGVLKTLLERRMIRISGRKAVVGKPFLYGTTRDFLTHFGLESTRDLPPLEEFEETLAAAADALGEGLEGTDYEEQALRESAELEDAEAEEPEFEDGAAQEEPIDSVAEDREYAEDAEDVEDTEVPVAAPSPQALEDPEPATAPTSPAPSPEPMAEEA